MKPSREVQSYENQVVTLSMALSFTGPFPSSYGAFTSIFAQPSTPNLTTEVQGHFLQHKWDNEVSHISSGYWYNSAENGKVRIDETYDGAFASSLFDYTNLSTAGVSNRQTVVSPSVGSEPTCFSDFVANPGFPLILSDLLVSYNATFGGVVDEPFLGPCQTWDFLAAETIPAVAYLDMVGLLLGFDFWGADRRTKVVTRFFAQQSGPIATSVFEDFPC